MTDATTAAGADDRVSEGALEAAHQLGYLEPEDAEWAARFIETCAITPALARHQQAVDELHNMLTLISKGLRKGALSDCVMRIGENPDDDRLLSNLVAECLAAHRPLTSQSQEKK